MSPKKTLGYIFCVYFNGIIIIMEPKSNKDCQMYIKITKENLFFSVENLLSMYF